MVCVLIKGLPCILCNRHVFLLLLQPDFPSFLGVEHQISFGNQLSPDLFMPFWFKTMRVSHFLWTTISSRRALVRKDTMGLLSTSAQWGEAESFKSPGWSYRRTQSWPGFSGPESWIKLCLRTLLPFQLWEQIDDLYFLNKFYLASLLCVNEWFPKYIWRSLVILL